MKLKALLIYAAILSVILTSCGKAKLIELKNESVRVSVDPAWITALEHPTAELKAVIDGINALTDEQKSPIAEAAETVNGAVLHLDIERENGDLTMITVVLLDDERGELRMLEHHTDTETQDGLVEFTFTDAELVSTVSEFIASCSIA